MIADFLLHLREAAPVILSLVIIEGLLSVDNMLGIATLASQLPHHQKRLALRTGLAGAYVFRGITLFFVGFIMANAWVKFFGAFYLIHLMAEHFSDFSAEIEADSKSRHARSGTFWSTVLAIQLMDLSLSVDNVVTAVAMSPELWVVCLGVSLGLVALWACATLSLKLIERHPVLEHAAFLLIGYVGMVLLVELLAEYAFHQHLQFHAGQKFIGVVVIIAISIWHSKNATLRRLCHPLCRAAIVPMVLYAHVSTRVITCIAWPFKALLRMNRGTDG